MEQRSNDAAAKDVQIKLRKEEYASNMEQPGQRNDAAVKGAQALPKREECVLGMEQN